MFGNILHFTGNGAKRLVPAVGKRFKSNCVHVYTKLLVPNSFANRINQKEIYAYRMRQVNVFLKQEGLSVKDQQPSCQHVWVRTRRSLCGWGAGAMVGGDPLVNKLEQVLGAGRGGMSSVW